MLLCFFDSMQSVVKQVPCQLLANYQHFQFLAFCLSCCQRMTLLFQQSAELEELQKLYVQLQGQNAQLQERNAQLQERDAQLLEQQACKITQNHIALSRHASSPPLSLHRSSPALSPKSPLPLSLPTSVLLSLSLSRPSGPFPPTYPQSNPTTTRRTGCCAIISPPAAGEEAEEV